MSVESELPVFVVGDVHGHVDRLEALLAEAECDERECLVVQLGDLGHFGARTREEDLLAWRRAEEGWVDLVLWGNHDRAVVDRSHAFGGYADPFPETVECVNRMERDGRVRLALAAHGWLITHAGLHPQVQHVDGLDATDAGALAEWLGTQGRRTSLVNAVGSRRGGLSSWGGILWRDAGEPLWDGVRQVFGHTASSQHVIRGGADEGWWCIDVGGSGHAEGDDCLAGIWLPSQEYVRVDL